MGEQRRQARQVPPPQPEPESATPPEPSSAGRLLAVVGQWTGREARALRIALRMPLGSFARHIGAGRSTVTDWEAAGAELILTWGLQNALDEALSEASDEQKLRFASPSGGTLLVRVPDSTGLLGNGADTDRTQFFKVIGAGLTVALGPLEEALERTSGGLGTPVRVDDGYLDALEIMTGAMQSAYGQPPRALLRHARPHLDAITDLLGGSMSGAHRQRLRVIAGAASMLVGAAAQNAGQWGDAQRHYAAATALGREAGHAALQAHSSGALAQMHLEAGDPSAHVDTAVEYIDQAWHLASTGPVPTVTRSCLAAICGLAKAAGGDADGLQAAAEDAHRALDHEGPTGIGGRLIGSWNPAIVELKLGEGLVLAGKADRALAVLQPSVGRMHGRLQTRATVYLGEAYLIGDKPEPEQGCQLLGDSAERAKAQGYGRGLRLVRGVHARIHERFAGLACMAALEERLRAAGA